MAHKYDHILTKYNLLSSKQHSKTTVNPDLQKVKSIKYSNMEQEGAFYVLPLAEELITAIGYCWGVTFLLGVIIVKFLCPSG